MTATTRSRGRRAGGRGRRSRPFLPATAPFIPLILFGAVIAAPAAAIDTARGHKPGQSARRALPAALPPYYMIRSRSAGAVAQCVRSPLLLQPLQRAGAGRRWPFLVILRHRCQCCCGSQKSASRTAGAPLGQQDGLHGEAAKNGVPKDEHGGGGDGFPPRAYFASCACVGLGGGARTSQARCSMEIAIPISAPRPLRARCCGVQAGRAPPHRESVPRALLELLQVLGLHPLRVAPVRQAQDARLGEEGAGRQGAGPAQTVRAARAARRAGAFPRPAGCAPPSAAAAPW